MRINNNLMAMNTHRQLGMANTGGAKSMEKLSSGFRINRAGDDAAGLAISEKMRGQIRGLNQASSNAQDGISLIQTTEGALNETHAILQRMRELAVQSSTDTNTDPDRENIQAEIDQLAEEITRISTDTEFNTMKLLNGDFAGKKFHIGANSGQNVEINVGDMGAEALKIIRAATSGEKAETVFNGDFTITADAIGKDGNENITIKFVDTAATGSGAVTTSGTFADGVLTITLGRDAGTGSGAKPAHTTITKTQLKSLLGEIVGVDVKMSSGATGTDTINTSDIATTIALTGGEDAADENVDLGINVSTQSSADKAITTINTALEIVSKERSKLGAIQNRLEHTIKNLDTSSENLQASEARIRDVDMAKEMMEQTKQNILQQASTAMLAQANQAPQTVLSLLR